MRRTTPVLGLVLLLVIAGCTTPGTGGADGTVTTGQATRSPTVASGTTAAPDTTTATESTTTEDTPAGDVSVDYSIRAGEIPDDVGSLDVTYRVVFVENGEDMGPCWAETWQGPYKPTITPIRPPSGDCHRSDPITVDLTTVEGDRSLGSFSAPGRFDAGHALIVTDVAGTYENGTAMSGIKGTGGLRPNVVEGQPADSYLISFSLPVYQDRMYRYWLVSERVDPAE